MKFREFVPLPVKLNPDKVVSVLLLRITLAENVEVHGAELVNGMLTLELEKIIPDAQKPRMIDIKAPKILGSK